MGETVAKITVGGQQNQDGHPTSNAPMYVALEYKSLDRNGTRNIIRRSSTKVSHTVSQGIGTMNEHESGRKYLVAAGTRTKVDVQPGVGEKV